MARRFFATDHDEIKLVTGDISGINDFTASYWAKKHGHSGDTNDFHYRPTLTADNEAGSPRDAFGHLALVRSSGTQGDFRLVVGGVGSAVQYTIGPDGQWYHVFMRREGATMKGYINGVLKATITAQTGAMTLYNLRWGRHVSTSQAPPTYTPWFNGEIAAGAMWDVALSDAEMSMLVAGWIPPLVRTSNMLFYHPMSHRGIEWDLERGRHGILTGTHWCDDPPLVTEDLPERSPLRLARMRVWSQYYKKGGGGGGLGVPNNGDDLENVSDGAYWSDFFYGSMPYN